MLRTLSSLLAPWPTLRVIGTALDGYHALRRVVELDPDLIVVGSRLEGMSVLDLVRQIRVISPEVRILVVKVGSSSTSAATVDACVELSHFERQLPALVEMLFSKVLHRPTAG